MSNYREMDKDSLVEEVKARRSQGRTIRVDLRSDAEALAAALEADDITNGTPSPAEPKEPVQPPPAAKTEPPAPSPQPAEKPDLQAIRNQVAKQPEAPTQPTQPSGDRFDREGSFARHRSDGLIYQVVRDENDEFKPVKARVPAQKSGHPGLYWEGTEEEFSACFDKV